MNINGKNISKQKHLNSPPCHRHLMMGSGRLLEGRSEGRSPRIEAGEPLEGLPYEVWMEHRVCRAQWSGSR